MLCLVGDCGKIVIFVIFAKFGAFANFYGAPIPLCALPRWRLWQNCHFRHICQIRRFCQLLWGPFIALCFVLCLVCDCGKIVIFAIFAIFGAFANFYGAPIPLCALPRWRLWQNCHFRHICQIRRFCQLLWGPFIALCFVLCLVCDCGKIVILAIFAKFGAFANFYGAPILLCAFPRWRLWQNCHFSHICQIRRFRQLLGGPYTALCFASLAIVAKLSFSPYLPNSALWPTFMGPLYCFVLCALPRWRLWQNCHFSHICQIRRFRQLLGGPYTALCFASLAIVAKLSFSPYLPNSALSPTFMGPLNCFVLCLVGDCGKIVILAIFAKFAAFANF